MIKTILSGESSPEVLAELVKALEGFLKPHHRFLIEQLLCHVDFLDEAIERVSEEIRGRLSPFEGKIELLRSIPAAVYILSCGETYRELGGDYFDRLSPQTLQRRLVRRLENLGYKVSFQTNSGI